MRKRSINGLHIERSLLGRTVALSSAVDVVVVGQTVKSMVVVIGDYRLGSGRSRCFQGHNLLSHTERALDDKSSKI